MLFINNEVHAEMIFNDKGPIINAVERKSIRGRILDNMLVIYAQTVPHSYRRRGKIG